jgi:RimJ/RimL family protein N-acetyltransferase
VSALRPPETFTTGRLPAIHRVWATCAPDNTASARVLEEADLMREGRLACREARPGLGQPAGDSLV